eukprot:jgi/Mesen1/1089/ME000123S00262
MEVLITTEADSHFCDTSNLPEIETLSHEGPGALLMGADDILAGWDDFDSWCANKSLEPCGVPDYAYTWQQMRGDEILSTSPVAPPVGPPYRQEIPSKGGPAGCMSQAGPAAEPAHKHEEFLSPFAIWIRGGAAGGMIQTGLAAEPAHRNEELAHVPMERPRTPLQVEEAGRAAPSAGFPEALDLRDRWREGIAVAAATGDGGSRGGGGRGIDKEFFGAAAVSSHVAPLTAMGRGRSADLAAAGSADLRLEERRRTGATGRQVLPSRDARCQLKLKLKRVPLGGAAGRGGRPGGRGEGRIMRLADILKRMEDSAEHHEEEVEEPEQAKEEEEEEEEKEEEEEEEEEVEEKEEDVEEEAEKKVEEKEVCEKVGVEEEKGEILKEAGVEGAGVEGPEARMDVGVAEAGKRVGNDAVIFYPMVRSDAPPDARGVESGASLAPRGLRHNAETKPVEMGAAQPALRCMRRQSATLVVGVKEQQQQQQEEEEEEEEEGWEWMRYLEAGTASEIFEDGEASTWPRAVPAEVKGEKEDEEGDDAEGEDENDEVVFVKEVVRPQEAPGYKKRRRLEARKQQATRRSTRHQQPLLQQQQVLQRGLAAANPGPAAAGGAPGASQATAQQEADAPSSRELIGGPGLVPPGLRRSWQRQPCLMSQLAATALLDEPAGGAAPQGDRHGLAAVPGVAPGASVGGASGSGTEANISAGEVREQPPRSGRVAPGPA